MLVGVLITVLLFGWYFLNSLSKDKSSDNFSPKPADSVQKEGDLYTNSSLGFEFKYNNDLRVLEDSEEEFNKRGNGNFRKNFTGYVGYEPGKVLGTLVVLDETSSYEANPFTVWVFDNPEQLDSKNWFEKYWFYPLLWGVFSEPDKGHVRPQNIATVSGQTTQSVVVSYQTGSPKYLYLSKNGMMYLFRVMGEVGEQTLSTFKFL